MAKLMDFIASITRLAGDAEMEKASLNEVIELLNIETRKACLEFPQTVQAEFDTTATGYYHSIDFNSVPRMAVTELMVDGNGATKKRWTYLKEATGDAV